jgi:hypothetical protein
VGNIRRAELRDEPRAGMYFPLEQRPASPITMVIRTGSDPLKALPLLQSTLRAIEPGVAVIETRTMSEVARVRSDYATRAVAAGPLCGDSADACRRRHLRHHVVGGSPADARDRQARGAGSDRQGHRLADHATGSGSRRFRHRDWLGGRACRYTSLGIDFVGDFGWGSSHVCGCGRGADCHDDGSLLPASAARCVHRPGQNTRRAVAKRGWLFTSPFLPVQARSCRPVPCPGTAQPAVMGCHPAARAGE